MDKTAKPLTLTIAFTAALLVATFVSGQGRVATNVGEDARKWDGGPGVPLHPDQKLELQMKLKRPFTVVAVGDLLEFQPFSKSLDPDVQFFVNLTHAADLTIGDLEDEIYDFDNFGHYGVNLGTKEVADDWANMGIKMVSRANNKDQSAPGVWEDLREVERVGIVHVGVAHSMPEARMARYLQLPQGLVGEVGASAEGGTDACCTGGTMVGVTSAQLAQMKAMKDSILARRKEVEVPVDMPPPDPDGTVNVFGITFTTATSHTRTESLGTGGRGRGGRDLGPNDGVKNSLNLTLFHGVTAEQMSQLRAIAGDTGTGDDLAAFGTQFRVMARPGEHSFDMNQKDLKEILTQIKTGKEASDFLAVNMHWHQNRFDFQHYSYDHFPADFEIKFAHDAIDEGADLFVAEGVHTIKGVEIYKGKPIFYGVSNYIFQSGLMPQAKGEAPGQTRSAVVAEPSGNTPQPAPDENGVVGEHQTQGFWQLLPNLEGLLSSSHYEDGKLTEVRIYPVDLGQSYRPTDQVGIPRKPSPAVTKKILDEVVEYSKPFGTKITIENGIAVIHISSGGRDSGVVNGTTP
jgi:poly-gamma-glutamate capsule biosynthesis protein CapA/YwtB (metallophosphatase superfamily)